MCDIGTMKTTIPILIAMLLVGNAVATEWPDAVRPSFDIRKCDITPGAVIPPSCASDFITKPVDPNVQWAASPSKVEYSIITLPSGETASVLTFH